MSKQPSLIYFREVFNSDISREHAKHFGVGNRKSAIGNGNLGGEGFEPPTLSV